ncbi:MAG TPA: helix-turn-helix domain-containing protein [Pseudonocardia sp.]|nr:helix-turn-helix domain-containing protein [Pseudonocardia sp.]
MATSKMLESSCSIARSLGVLGERWTFLVLREAFTGTTRFAQFREALGVAPDVLAARLTTLVDHGVLVREPYQEAGSRPRDEYRLTEAGRALQVTLGALQQWGDRYLPWPAGPTAERRTHDTGRPVHVGFIDDLGHEVAPDNVDTVRTATFPAKALPTEALPTEALPTEAFPTKAFPTKA